jgi:hypothetical protein
MFCRFKNLCVVLRDFFMNIYLNFTIKKDSEYKPLFEKDNKIERTIVMEF